MTSCRKHRRLCDKSNIVSISVSASFQCLHNRRASPRRHLVPTYSKTSLRCTVLEPPHGNGILFDVGKEKVAGIKRIGRICRQD